MLEVSGSFSVLIVLGLCAAGVFAFAVGLVTDKVHQTRLARQERGASRSARFPILGVAKSLIDAKGIPRMGEEVRRAKTTNLNPKSKQPR